MFRRGLDCQLHRDRPAVARVLVDFVQLKRETWIKGDGLCAECVNKLPVKETDGGETPQP